MKVATSKVTFIGMAKIKYVEQENELQKMPEGVE